MALTYFVIISEILPELAVGFSILAIATFIVGVNLSYYNKPSLKFSDDNELHISEVAFNFRDYISENKEVT
ncbi:MAG: hypothetical protein UGF89_01905 [Acutalibacteraceae bacterium]|nr:hypothetical protein [Acutalibacteraceae bacterium]